MTKRHRRHSTAKKREIVEAYFNGESMRALSQKYDVCRTLIPIWIDRALLRSGRLETRIDIPLPDVDALVAILRHHLKDDVQSVIESVTSMEYGHAERRKAGPATQMSADAAGLQDAAGGHDAVGHRDAAANAVLESDQCHCDSHGQRDPRSLDPCDPPDPDGHDRDCQSRRSSSDDAGDIPADPDRHEWKAGILEPHRQPATTTIDRAELRRSACPPAGGATHGEV